MTAQHRIRPQHRPLFQPHTNGPVLIASGGCDTALASQPGHIHSVRVAHIRAMRDMVTELADLCLDFRPTLVPFFATGSIPLVVPLIHRLYRLGERQLTRPEVFHLFPGLAWSGAGDRITGSALFQAEFPRLLSTTGPNRILCVDTTNTGNAVNKAIAELLLACHQAGSKAEIRVVGVVNAQRACPQGSGMEVVRDSGPSVWVTPPNGVQFDSPPRNRVFHKVVGALVPSNIDLRVSYWVADAIPTEDEEALIGAIALHHELAIENNPAPGRLRIVSDNGECPEVTSAGSVASVLLSSLAKDDGDAFWKWANSSDGLPVADDETRQCRDEIAWATEGAKRLFEYRMAPDALATIKSLPTQYTAAEVQFLLTQRCFEAVFVRRIIAALRVSQFSDARLVERAVAYFRLGNPVLRRNRPTTIDRATECRWWIPQLERAAAASRQGLPPPAAP